MSRQPRVLCAVCRRHIPVRNDGRLQAHLAVYGRREKCEGSGGFSARMQMASEHDAPPDRPSWDRMSKAERFNAHDEWMKADTLYEELEMMCQLGAASPAAIAAAESALRRAVNTAKALAPISFAWLPDGGAESA